MQRRRDELLAEREHVTAEISAYEELIAERDRCRETVERLRDRLDSALTGAGLAKQPSASESLVAVRHACEQRRRHDDARRTTASAAQRRSAMGDLDALTALVSGLRGELSSRGATQSQSAVVPDDPALQQLDTEVRRAAQALNAASSQANELRARLAGVLEGLPDLADLEDERDALRATRDRCLQQQRALLRAAHLLEQASRGTHRDIAPRLADAVARNLSLLTQDRYRAVNVDTDHFAVSLLGTERPDMVPLELLSHGTRDQVALLLRMALCEVLSDGHESTPLLLDEPLLTADPARRRGMLEFLRNLAGMHQVVVSTADPAVARELQEVCAGGCSVVTLDERSEQPRDANQALQLRHVVGE